MNKRKTNVRVEYNRFNTPRPITVGAGFSVCFFSLDDIPGLIKRLQAFVVQPKCSKHGNDPATCAQCANLRARYPDPPKRKKKASKR